MMMNIKKKCVTRYDSLWIIIKRNFKLLNTQQQQFKPIKFRRTVLIKNFFLLLLFFFWTHSNSNTKKATYIGSMSYMVYARMSRSKRTIWRMCWVRTVFVFRLARTRWYDNPNSIHSPVLAWWAEDDRWDLKHYRSHCIVGRSLQTNYDYPCPSSLNCNRHSPTACTVQCPNKNKLWTHSRRC